MIDPGSNTVCSSFDAVDTTGKLTPQAADTTTAVLSGFRGKCGWARVMPEQIITVATSVLRAAIPQLCAERR